MHRFKWSKVDPDRLNDLLDSAHVLELELNEDRCVCVHVCAAVSQHLGAVYVAVYALEEFLRAAVKS